jgi:hypothetical protein
MKKSSGFSIVAALMGLAMVTSAALLLMSALGFFKANEVRSRGRVLIQNSLLETAAYIRNVDFSTLQTLCETRGAYGADLLPTSKCLDPANRSQFNPDPNESTGVGPSANANLPKIVDVRLDLKTGYPSMTGESCVALAKCDEKVSNQFIEVRLVGYWRDPDSRRAPQINQSQLIIERVRD